MQFEYLFPQVQLNFISSHNVVLQIMSLSFSGKLFQVAFDIRRNMRCKWYFTNTETFLSNKQDKVKIFSKFHHRIASVCTRRRYILELYQNQAYESRVKQILLSWVYSVDVNGCCTEPFTVYFISKRHMVYFFFSMWTFTHSCGKLYDCQWR